MLLRLQNGIKRDKVLTFQKLSATFYSTNQDEIDDEEEELKLSPQERQQKIQSILRSSLGAEGALLGYLKGQSFNLSQQIDRKFFVEQEAEQAEKLQQLLPNYKTRPSLSAPVLQKFAFGAGLVSQISPKWVNLVAAGAIQDAFSDHYADVMRSLTALGVDDSELKEAMKGLRDVQRAPEGAPDPPDVTMVQNIQKLEDLGYEGAVGVMVKTICRSIFDITQKI